MTLILTFACFIASCNNRESMVTCGSKKPAACCDDSKIPVISHGSKKPAISCDSQKPAISSSDNKTKMLKTKETVIADLKDQYWNYYQPQDELTIKSIEDLPSEDIKIKLTLQVHTRNFSHFLISTDDSQFRKSLDGSIVAEFKIDETSAMKTTTVVKIVSQNGTTSQPYTITLVSNPNKYWASKGAAGYPNWITVKTDPYLNFNPPCTVDNWIYRTPADSDRKFAENKWGGLIKDAKSNHDKAKLIAKSLMDDLKPHIGVPSDAMKVPPFEQYERMVSGHDNGFCTNLADIFIHACNSLGVPARRIHLEKVHYRSDKFSIRMGGMHSTTEIFDDQLNQWVWLDLTYNILGAYLGEEGPLNVAEFSMFLNQSQRRKSLKVLYYNYRDKSEELMLLNQCPEKFASLDGRDTEFHYFYAPTNELSF